MKTFELNGIRFKVNDDDEQFCVPEGAVEVVELKRHEPKNKARVARNKQATSGTPTADSE